MTAPRKRTRIGEAVFSEGILSPDQLSKALADQKATGRMLGELLVEQGFISGGMLVQVLARTLGVKGCHLRHGLIDPPLLKLVGAEEAERGGQTRQNDEQEPLGYPTANRTVVCTIGESQIRVAPGRRPSRCHDGANARSRGRGRHTSPLLGILAASGSGRGCRRNGP